jgi:hypothetical protein
VVTKTAASVPSGFYMVSLRLAMDNKVAGRNEVVHIYNSLTSKFGTVESPVVFTEDDFAHPGAPFAPATPTVVPGDQELAVSWIAVDGATAYEVWYHTADNSVAAQKYGADFTALTTTITGLNNGTPYYVWVKAKNGVGSSAFSGSVSGTPLPPPAAPAAPAVMAGNQQLTVSWTAVSGATAYEVWHGTANDTGSAQQSGGDVTGTTTTITGLANGTTYYVWIKAKNSAGTSGFSPSASGTPQVPVPAAPGKPTVTAGDSQLTVSWTAVSGATTYEVWHGTANNTGSAQQSGGDVTTTTATITGLTNGTTYYVWVKAKNGGGTSGFSPSASGTPQVPAPGKPTITLIKSNNTQTTMTGQGGTISLTWGAVSGATSYEVYYAAAEPDIPSIPTSPALTVTTTSATITANNIGDNTMDYYVWVKAVNASNEKSPASPPASTLERFIGMWSGGWDDYYIITNADVMYDMGYGSSVYGYIRAVVPFDNGSDNVSVQVGGVTHTGAAGVIIVEYDEGYMQDSGWTYNGNLFNASYYYGLTGSGAGSSSGMGFAFDTAPGPEVDTVDAAIAKFTLTDMDDFVTISAEYEWSE